MASIKLKFRTSSVQEKEGRLYYQVIHNRVARQIHTEYRIYSSEWDADHSNIILPTSVTPQRQAYLLTLFWDACGYIQRLFTVYYVYIHLVGRLCRNYFCPP